jgi:hypothetical protein
MKASVEAMTTSADSIVLEAGGFTAEALAELKAMLEKHQQQQKTNHNKFPFEEDEYWAEVRKHVTEATTMPPEGFRSPEFYKVEQHKLFAKTWQVVAFTDQLRHVGDIVTATTAGQPVLLTKDKSGEIRAFYNVCRHRGARLVRETECSGEQKKNALPAPIIIGGTHSTGA